MSTTTEQNISQIEATTDIGIEQVMQDSTLGQLGLAIRHSIVAFVIASIMLILTFILIINRHHTLHQITHEINIADQFYAETLSMQTAEKDYAMTGLEKYLITYESYYDKAQKDLAILLANHELSDQQQKTLKRLQVNAKIFQQVFNETVALQKERGFDINEEGTVLHSLAMEAKKFYTTSAGISISSNIDNALLRLRLLIKDYIHLESPEIIPQVLDAGNTLKKVIAESSKDLSSDQLRSILNTTNQYIALFEKYASLTKNVKQHFSDTTIAAHSAQNLIPSFTQDLLVRQSKMSSQLFYILPSMAVVLIAIFLFVVYQLRRAQQGANRTLQDTIASQEEARAENERLNDSVINILEAVHALSQRDLRVRAPVTEDVIGTVSDSINGLAEETARVLSGVTNIAGQVSLVSDRVKEQALQVSETAKEERESVNQMIEALLDATQVMNQVAALAEETNESATQATSATDGALQTVTATVEGMDTIRQTIAETEKRIKRLGERSQEISGIVNLINTISERTHVLALNASMQAAVAGDAGRGFAVVAQEVQQLAESSRHATDQIATLVNNIQIETNETINTVNYTISQVVEGTEQAQRAGVQMQQTQEITAKLVASVASIAQASQQQKNLSADLLVAVQKIGESTARTAEQIAAQNTGTENLQKAAADLLQSVNVFKLPEVEY